MAARVTEEEVKAIKPTTLSPLDPFIDAASCLVDDLAASDCGSGFDDARLTKIELYLSAHFVCVADPATLTERFEGGGKTFQRGANTGTGLLSSSYGQTANMLSNGCLGEIEKTSAGVQFA